MYYVNLPVIAVLAGLAIGMSAVKTNASESDNLTAEIKQIQGANAGLDSVYQRILGILDERIKAGSPGSTNFKSALVEAERAWIKWRDAGAPLRAYGGGPGGRQALPEGLPFYL